MIVIEIPLREITISPDNTRKLVDRARITDLTRPIKEHGVIFAG